MLIFKPEVFTYKNQTLTVPANQVLRLIAAVEQHFNLFEVQACKAFSAATIAINYAPVLEAAGFTAVCRDELALHFSKNNEEATAAVMRCINLMQLLQAPEDLAPKDDEAEKKPTAPQAE